MSITTLDWPGSLSVQYLWPKASTLSPAEKRLLNLEKEGKPIKEIAGEMQLSSREVQRLIMRIKSKLKEGNTDDGWN